MYDKIHYKKKKNRKKNKSSCTLWLVMSWLVHELIFSSYNLKMKFVMVKWKRKKSISCKMLLAPLGWGQSLGGFTWWSMVRTPHVTLLVSVRAQSRPALCHPTDSSPPGSPVRGFFHARTLEAERKDYLIWKDPDAGKDWRWEGKG